MNTYINRKERIILTTIEIINDLGFQGLSIKEICRRQEFSEGSLYKHFESKNEIILGALDYYSKFDEEIKETIKLKNFSAKESILYFISSLAEICENEPAMTAILNSYEILRNEVGVAKKVTEIFESRSNLVMQLIEKGIDSGEFKSGIKGDNLSDVIFGSFIAITLKWRISNYSFKLKERILSTINMVL